MGVHTSHSTTIDRILSTVLFTDIANSTSQAAGPMGLDLRRAGAHSGEIELRGDDVGGIAVHIASRVASLAAAGEILDSRTVKVGTRQ